jgi:type II secretory pathway predicted ATPase ExeA
MSPHSFEPTDELLSVPADPHVFFAGSGHVRTLRHLEQAMAQDDRLVVLTGDEGVGKTTVVQRLLSGFDRGAIWCVSLSATQLDTGALPGSLARAFGAPTGDGSPAALHAGLRRHLASHANGRTIIALIDDAHALPPEAIGELGEQTSEGPLRVLLVGRPPLRMILAQQLPLQPASLSCHLEPLQESETPAYIAHTLQRSGWNGTPEFSDEAQALIHRFSRGVPLRIDRLCNRLLRAARQRDEPTIAADAVRRIARPRLDDSAIPMLTSALDELPSGWAASTDLPPDSELPRWARTEEAAAAADGADAGVAVRRQRRIGLALTAAVLAAALAVWAYRSLAPQRADASMTTALPSAERAASMPAAPTAPTAMPAPQPQPQAQPPTPMPATEPAQPRAAPVAPVVPPRAAAAPPRAAVIAPPQNRAGAPVAKPPPVPGPCTATVAALGLCTLTENPP